MLTGCALFALKALRSSGASVALFAFFALRSDRTNRTDIAGLALFTLWTLHTLNTLRADTAGQTSGASGQSKVQNNIGECAGVCYLCFTALCTGLDRTDFHHRCQSVFAVKLSAFCLLCQFITDLCCLCCCRIGCACRCNNLVIQGRGCFQRFITGVMAFQNNIPEAVRLHGSHDLGVAYIANAADGQIAGFGQAFPRHKDLFTEGVHPFLVDFLCGLGSGCDLFGTAIFLLDRLCGCSDLGVLQRENAPDGCHLCPFIVHFQNQRVHIHAVSHDCGRLLHEYLPLSHSCIKHVIASCLMFSLQGGDCRPYNPFVTSSFSAYSWTSIPRRDRLPASMPCRSSCCRCA